MNKCIGCGLPLHNGQDTCDECMVQGVYRGAKTVTITWKRFCMDILGMTEGEYDKTKRAAAAIKPRGHNRRGKGVRADNKPDVKRKTPAKRKAVSGDNKAKMGKGHLPKVRRKLSGAEENIHLANKTAKQIAHEICNGIEEPNLGYN